MSRRVVVTGVGGISPMGVGWEQTRAKLQGTENCIRRMPWDHIEDLQTKLGAPAENVTFPSHFTRKRTRGMGRNAKLATLATEMALTDAGLLGEPLVKSGQLGISWGSSAGSTDAFAEFTNLLRNNSLEGLNATTYVRMMSHTAAVNIGVFFGITGRIVPTSSACTAGSQGIGYAYEAIRYGRQDLMVAGGSEELCPTEAAVFDVLYATSTKNDSPQLTPSPFDADRDGLVIGEGACSLILEEYEHARARGANILCEIVGFGTNADGTHVTQPNKVTMQRALEMALGDAGLSGNDISYVNAHGTATEHGDIAESQATRGAIGRAVPISSIKSYTGHTLGACGALEAWCSINMLNEGWVCPTLNLTRVDPRCGELDYVAGSTRAVDGEFFMSNNFAFGGINTSLIFRKLS